MENDTKIHLRHLNADNITMPLSEILLTKRGSAAPAPPPPLRSATGKRHLSMDKEYLTNLIFGSCRTLVVISMASGAYFSTSSSTDQKSRRSLRIPFFAAKGKVYCTIMQLTLKGLNTSIVYLNLFN